MRFSSGTSRWWIAAYLAVTLVCTTGMAHSQSAAGGTDGLRRQVWLVNDFQGTPAINDVAREPTLDFLDDDPRLPREFFSARWRGYWYVPSRRSFTLHVQAGRLRRHLDRWGTTVCSEFRGGAAGTTRRWRPRAADCLPAVPGAVHLGFTGGSGDAYQLPLRTGYLFPTQPEPNPAAVGGYCRPTDTHRRHPLGLRVRWAQRSSSSGGGAVSDALPVGGSGGARFRSAGRPRVGEEMARRFRGCDGRRLQSGRSGHVCRAGIPSRFGSTTSCTAPSSGRTCGTC